MPALPENLLTSLTNIAHAPRLQSCFLQPLDMAPDETPPWAQNATTGTAIKFQYWPETLQDTRQSEWNPRNIPGGSHPIYQWTHGGERTLTFTSVFATSIRRACERASTAYFVPISGVCPLGPQTLSGFDRPAVQPPAQSVARSPQ